VYSPQIVLWLFFREVPRLSEALVYPVMGPLMVIAESVGQTAGFVALVLGPCVLLFCCAYFRSTNAAWCFFSGSILSHVLLGLIASALGAG
jgi:hypothetical protein